MKSIDPTDSLRASIEYAYRTYGNAPPERLAEMAREKADREARATSMRPRLSAAIDAYWRLTRGDDLTAEIALLHMPRHDHPTLLEPAHCEGCDIDGMDPEYPSWPCTTAHKIAAAHGINLDGMETYDWR